ncbi:MAG: NAD(+)/NADH kinase [Oscillospiraceae bacterium]|nr:NAD(+)/NADH kinase [Oscillospiraceae bacterium]
MAAGKGKIILCPNAASDVGFEMTRRVGEMLGKRGRQYVMCPVFEETETIEGQADGFEAAALENELPCAEMIITFGGDGTILRAARAAADLGIPVLGINMGGKGFMAELEVGDINLLDSAAVGNYEIDRRMMLDVEVRRDGEPVCRDFALNDVVVRGDNKVIDLIIFGDAQRITSFSGDGAVIATPTGSTAYSMAAGGPLVEPSAHNIIVTPICAHMLEAKSFVLVSDRCVSVEIGWKKHNPAYMSVDGCEHVNILGGDEIKIRKSGKYTRLVRLTDKSFYKKVSDKLGEQV